MQKGSPLLPAINKKLRTLHESGMIDTWVSEHVGHSKKCDSVKKVVSSNTMTRAVLTLGHVDRVARWI